MNNTNQRMVARTPLADDNVIPLPTPHRRSIHLQKEEDRHLGVEIDIVAHPDNGVAPHASRPLLKFAHGNEKRMLEVDLPREIFVRGKGVAAAPCADLTPSDCIVDFLDILLAKLLKVARELTTVSYLHVDLAEHIVLGVKVDGGNEYVFGVDVHALV